MKNYDQIIDEYFARNKDRSFLRIYRHDLCGLMQSVLLERKVEETEKELQTLKELIKNSITKIYKNPFKIFVELKKIRKEINSGNV